MKKNYLVLFLALSIAGVLLGDTTWVTLDQQFTDSTYSIAVDYSDYDSTILDISIPGFFYQDTIEGSDTLKMIWIKGKHTYYLIDSLPKLPFLGITVGIPPTKAVECTVLSYNDTILYSYRIYPYAETTAVVVVVDEESLYYSQNIYAIDTAFYNSDTLWPSDIMLFSTPKILQDVRVTQISLFPFVVDPPDSGLRVYKNMKVKLIYSGTDTTNSMANNDYSEHNGDSLLHDMIINFSYLSTTTSGLSDKLIIVAKPTAWEWIESSDWFDLWVEMRLKEGFEVEIVIVDDGDSPTDIRNEILTHTNMFSREYICIIGADTTTAGDDWGVPVDLSYKYYAWFPAHYSVRDIPNDFFYSHEGDDIPDFAVGRIPADNSDEFYNYMDKLCHYESYMGYSQEEFISLACLSSTGIPFSFPEDLSSALNSVLRNLPIDDGMHQKDWMYDIASITISRFEDNLDNESAGILTLISPLSIYSIYAEEFIWWKWSSSVSITAAWKESLIPLTTPSHKITPALWSFLDQGGTRLVEPEGCFGKSWLCIDNELGSVCYHGRSILASQYTDWSIENANIFGIIHGSDFMPTLRSYYRGGYLTAYVNCAIINPLGATWDTDLSADHCHHQRCGVIPRMYFGDPTMDITDRQKRQFALDFPLTIRKSTYGDLTVNVKDQVTSSNMEDVRVCLWRGVYDDATNSFTNSLLDVIYTNSSGNATFTVPFSATSTEGYIYVTATRHNYLRESQPITVSDPIPSTAGNLPNNPPPDVHAPGSSRARVGAQPPDSVFRVDSTFAWVENEWVLWDDSLMSESYSYWLFGYASEEDSFIGIRVDTIEIDLLPGWNLIGSLDSTHAWDGYFTFDTTTKEILCGPIDFDTSGYYKFLEDDSIHATFGYWVYASDSCTLTFPASGSDSNYYAENWKCLRDLPNPPHIEDTAHFALYFSYSGDSVLVIDKETGDSVENALVIGQVGDDFEYAYTNSSGYVVFSNVDIGDNDSTWIYCHKIGYVDYTHHPYGTVENGDTMWGDVYITGDVAVESGDTLTILPGTNVYVKPTAAVWNYANDLDDMTEILAYGGFIQVVGTEEDNVTFQADSSFSAGDWYGINVQSGGKLTMEYAQINHAYNAIVIESGTDTVSISNTEIELAENAGIIAESDLIYIDGCEIDSAGSYGIYVDAAEIQLLEDNSIKRCSYGIFLTGEGAEADMLGSIIDSCDIGIHIQDYADFWAGDTVSEDSLADNTITNCWDYLVRNSNKDGPDSYCQNVWWGTNQGPNVNLIGDSEYGRVLYSPWTQVPYDCSSPNVLCVPSEYPTIDSAITLADTTGGTYDTVYIGVGTFEERDLIVDKPILIVGSGIDSTIIDGQNLPPRVFTTDDLASGDTIWAEHFTIRNGLDTTTTDSRSAAGWQIYNISGLVMLDSVKFESCTSMTAAGAIGSWLGGLSIDHCYFIDNYGGLTAVESRDNDNKFWVKNSRFTNNSAQYGGGIKIYSQNYSYIENCIFEQNTATKWGGAINARYSASNKYYNNTFFGNFAEVHGGATDHTISSSTTWLNCIFRNDSTDGNGDEIYIENSTYHLLYCNIDTMDIYGKSYLNSKIGLVDSDPYFWDEEELDLHLTDSSACIEAGKDTLNADTLDFDGVARSDTFDIGAYEYYGEYSPKTAEQANVKLPEVSRLGDIYPNPFNSTVTVEFMVSEASDIQIDVFSIDGRLARRLLRRPIDKGQWKTVWDGRDTSGREVSSGVYLVKMKIGGEDLETKTVTLIK